MKRAEIIIPRRQLDAASNDVGFVRDRSGVYQAIISEYDRGIGFDEMWLGRLAQAYKERQTMAVAKAKGWRELDTRIQAINWQIDLMVVKNL